MEIWFLILLVGIFGCFNVKKNSIRSYNVPIAKPIKEIIADPKASKQLQQCIVKGFGTVDHPDGIRYHIYKKSTKDRVNTNVD